MLQRQRIWQSPRVMLALGLGCLAAVIFAGCGSSASSSSSSKATPTPSVRAVAAVPAGFTTFKNTDFRLAYPTGWAKQNPANGKGVQYQGPKEQVFVAANLGKLNNTPEAFDKAFCSPSGFGGKPDGAPKTVKINGQNWVRQQCVDDKCGKSAVVEATIYDKNFYYMVYASPTASFQANKTQYFNTMEQSFTFMS